MHNIYEPEYVRRLFNRMSASYERMNYSTSFGFSIRWRRQCIAGLASDQKDIRVIDLLSGLGENWSTLAQAAPKRQLHRAGLSLSAGVLTKRNRLTFRL